MACSQICCFCLERDKVGVSSTVDKMSVLLLREQDGNTVPILVPFLSIPFRSTFTLHTHT